MAFLTGFDTICVSQLWDAPEGGAAFIVNNSQVIEERLSDGLATSQKRWMVVIYNNDVTAYDVVVAGLMRATACNYEEAAIETWEAHVYGKCAVHFSSESECQKCAEIISQIGVRTKVCREWEE